MIATVHQHLLLQRYEQFAKTLYAERKDEVIVGSYLSVAQANDGVCGMKKKKKRKDKLKAKTSVICLKNNFCIFTL